MAWVVETLIYLCWARRIPHDLKLPSTKYSNIFYIRQEEDGTWTPGSIISDSSMGVLTFTETIKASKRRAACEITGGWRIQIAGVRSMLAQLLRRTVWQSLVRSGYFVYLIALANPPTASIGCSVVCYIIALLCASKIICRRQSIRGRSFVFFGRIVNSRS